ncbi:sensor histidine kinase [Paenibacillus sp. PL2-23]|uniref:sensor histidine kinase n=1 Tax=Paenibacillus sp. PL2-23 TaxID=2100729 RepID=UPI0030F830B7
MDERRRNAVWLLFLKDRKSYLLCYALLLALGCCLYLLENIRYPGLVDTSTLVYFVLLALVICSSWLVIDYMRQRPYYKQVFEALARWDELGGAAIIHTMATEEQRLVTRLMREQHRAYLNELNAFKRQQEVHNHFVLQWVHHMKTPVSVVDLLLQEVRRQPPSDEGKWVELAESIHEETERMARSLEMMLHTARLEKFELDLHIRRISLHDFIRSVVNAHKRQCIKYSIFPRIEGEAWAETDEKWMAFVLNQLISNAIKYSKLKSGSKTLLFRLSETEGESGGIRLQVVDSGIGIAAHDLPRIFDPFFTGENGRTTGESTGMGLYLAKQVCGRLGMTIEAESELGAGTTFTLYFHKRGIHVLEE